ncbi:hypothetical protein JCGZ_04984 [Jatropha curcas]|uniref:TIR domain-containing protein n=1 Tax=Jatropha curcas TaxID=180498 RepID=A0A067KRT3_JATCU|nr:hypothetical protein JCGZ_04984 [Jatropha curcas]
MGSSLSFFASTSSQRDPSFIINANAASSPSSTSSQQTPSELNNYDVFINFRGKDIRDRFLPFLFESLKEKGIHTFKDENLQKGTEITPALKQTIQESCISIVIFSKNYADSPWCLDELVVINECREKSGQRVLPVFYRVDPTDVQELRGPFARALARLLKDHSDSSHNLGGWCHALKTISNDLSAFVSNEINLPSFLQLENLEILYLQGCSNLEECPELPCNLRNLNLSETAIKQLPSSIGHCSQLVALSLSGCTKLQNLPECIGQLQSLKRIYVRGLKFSTLPNNFGYLKSLKELDAIGSGIKTLPSSFNQLSRLECLNFKGCKGLTVWPSSLSGLNSLQKLNLSNCGISEIPESIGSLVSLKELYLDGNDFESIPASIKQLSHLETFRLNDCKRLRYLPELPGTRLFSASNCTSLEFVSFSCFPKADTAYGIQLNFGNCTKLGDNVRLQIAEALFSAPQGWEHHRLCIPGVEVPPSMKYRTSGSHLSCQLEKPDRLLSFFYAAVIDFQDFDFYGYGIRGVVKFQDKAGKIYKYEYGCNFDFLYFGLRKFHSKHVFLGYKSFDHERNFTRVSFQLDHFTENNGFVSSWRVINCGIHPIYREEYRKAEVRND